MGLGDGINCLHDGDGNFFIAEVLLGEGVVFPGGFVLIGFTPGLRELKGVRRWAVWICLEAGGLGSAGVGKGF